MKKTYMKATSFRAAMGFVVALIIGGSIFGFYTAQDMLTTYAKEISEKIPKADAQITQTAATNKLKSDITLYKSTADKAASMLASDQDMISQRLNSFATSTNLSISNTTFSQPSPTGTVGSTPPLIGAVPNFATITISNPTNFSNLMRFIKAIEGSMPKMRVTNLIISQTSRLSNNVQVNPITIEYYTKQ
jgi:hypothetical protein